MSRIGYERRDDVLYIQLWDNEELKAIYGDMDRLEIHDVKIHVPYDRAINALVVELHNYSTKGAGYLKGIPVKIVGQPDIPIGSLNLLESEFQTIEKKIK